MGQGKVGQGECNGAGEGLGNWGYNRAGNRVGQNCKQLVMYMNNWDKGVPSAICLCIFSAGEY